jgi:hypothetical protein
MEMGNSEEPKQENRKPRETGRIAERRAGFRVQGSGNSRRRNYERLERHGTNSREDNHG